MPDRAHKPKTPGSTEESAAYDAPEWLSTEELEEELFLAAIGDSNGTRAESEFARIDAYFAADRTQADAEYRRSLMRLLADLRPQLAELTGGPRAKQ